MKEEKEGRKGRGEEERDEGRRRGYGRRGGHT